MLYKMLDPEILGVSLLFLPASEGGLVLGGFGFAGVVLYVPGDSCLRFSGVVLWQCACFCLCPVAAFSAIAVAFVYVR